MKKNIILMGFFLTCHHYSFGQFLSLKINKQKFKISDTIILKIRNDYPYDTKYVIGLETKSDKWEELEPDIDHVGKVETYKIIQKNSSKTIKRKLPTYFNNILRNNRTILIRFRIKEGTDISNLKITYSDSILVSK